jgi:hypothetical protein
VKSLRKSPGTNPFPSESSRRYKTMGKWDNQKQTCATFDFKQ